MKTIIVLLLITSNAVIAQNSSITQFAIWKPKDGQENHFENGYKRHLQWHKNNGDTWNWYGWTITSGLRAGWFIDATDNHTWKDFDSSVKPAEDWADNVLNVVPFADFQTVYKVSLLKELSQSDTLSLKSKYLRMVTLNVTDLSNAMKIVEQLKKQYDAKSVTRHFLVYKMIDGGNLNQVILFLGFSSMADFGKSESLQEDISVIENGLKLKTVTSSSSETLVFRADLSLFPN